MALSIDTKPLRDIYIPQLQRDLDTYAGGRKRRFHICRVHVLADLLSKRAATTINQLFHEERLKWARQDALQWQADPGDDLDEQEVFKHLKQQAETSPLLERAVSQSKCKKHVTTLVASFAVQPPPIFTENRNPPFFHRYCIRWSIISIWGNDLSMRDSAIPPVFPNAPKRNRSWWPYLELKIDGANYAVGKKPAVLWQLQFDFVDLQQTYCSFKRRRINPFQQVPSAPVEKERLVKEYRGVRDRKARKTPFIVTWKPSSSRNKVDFCAFKSKFEAALGADAVFHYYGRHDLLNFPKTTPQILSKFPLPWTGLDEKGMIKFVQEKVKWLASQAPELRSSTTAESSSRAPSGFPTTSEPLSIPSSESDDGRSQSQDWFQEAITSAAIDTVQEPGQVPFQGSHDGPLLCVAGNSMHISDEWDPGSKRPTFSALSNMVSTPPSEIESLSSLEDLLIMSPPAPFGQVPQSPMYDVDAWLGQSELWNFSGTPVDGCLLLLDSE